MHMGCGHGSGVALRQVAPLGWVSGVESHCPVFDCLGWLTGPNRYGADRVVSQPVLASARLFSGRLRYCSMFLTACEFISESIWLVGFTLERFFRSTIPIYQANRTDTRREDVCYELGCSAERMVAQRSRMLGAGVISRHRIGSSREALRRVHGTRTQRQLAYGSK